MVVVKPSLNLKNLQDVIVNLIIIFNNQCILGIFYQNKAE